ncbi:MAG TPA: hypothetical protein VFQ61_30335 [Polyangiaceae bacterium]|nr:hypothetical protein [Polyangiaceae bacterium]
MTAPALSPAVLHGLRDVEGVLGSFILSETGELLLRDLPGIFDNELFYEAGPRLTRLCDALSAQGEPLEAAGLRYAEHKLHLRRAQGCILCVLSTAQANPPALKMALSLLARRLEIRAAELRAPEMTASPQSPLPSGAGKPASAPPSGAQKSNGQGIVPGTGHSVHGWGPSSGQSGARQSEPPPNGTARVIRTYRGRPIE